ncbi:MAG: hypothetical protein BA869_10780 [Desulfuromonadales bacterium C00003107]|nr:MAG: hypothetical protein BA869_10780 [Desulfuromonadales bacterium C00003107]
MINSRPKEGNRIYRTDVALSGVTGFDFRDGKFKSRADFPVFHRALDITKPHLVFQDGAVLFVAP